MFSFLKKTCGLERVVLIQLFILGFIIMYRSKSDMDFKINYGEKRNGNPRKMFETSNVLPDKANAGNTSCKQEMTSETYMDDRLKDVAGKCSALMSTEYFKNLKPTGTVWVYKPLGLFYCMTPKVGCTFWKRIMRFISGDYNEPNVESPSDIDRFFVHYGKTNRLGIAKMKTTEQRKTISTKKSFMFARDPYSRLWSAYIDKFLLPDFWGKNALRLMKMVRTNASLYDRTCANDATFLEFIKFVVKLGVKDGFDEHWEPASRICSPCHVTFDAIGKQESFAQDSEYILSLLNMESLSVKESSRDRAIGEINMLVDYNLRLESAIRKGCFKRLDVAEKLWKAFQFNGYIHRSEKFPAKKVSEFISLKTHIANYTDFILDMIAAQEKRGLSLKSQKREMMAEAYKEIPRDYIRQLQKIYKYDFELFDYDSCPSDLSTEC